MHIPRLKLLIAAAMLPLLVVSGANGQDRSNWERPERMDLPPSEPDPSSRPAPSYRPDTASPNSAPPATSTPGNGRAKPNDAYVPPPTTRSAWGDGSSSPPPEPQPRYQQGYQQGYPADSQPPGDGYRPGAAADAYRDRGPDSRSPRDAPPPAAYGEPPRGSGYGTPYEPPRDYGEDGDNRPPPRGQYADQIGPGERSRGGTYSENEVLDAGHRFFGSISQALANAVESIFQQSGRPNGYMLGEDAGGAFIAGLRYGEGVLHTKDAGRHRVYWQGPSLGYDFGGEGSKTMVLVYNLRDPADIYDRFGGIQGSAYLIGGLSVQFQKSGDVILAHIRSGVGLRLGANVGYLKYTRTPTWNPF